MAAVLQRVYRKSELPQYCGLQRSQISELIRLGKFPEAIPVYEGGRAIVWLESDLIAWQLKMIAQRDNSKEAAT